MLDAHGECDSVKVEEKFRAAGLAQEAGLPHKFVLGFVSCIIRSQSFLGALENAHENDAVNYSVLIR